MVGPTRIDFPGAWYHVRNRGIKKWLIFRSRPSVMYRRDPDALPLWRLRVLGRSRLEKPKSFSAVPAGTNGNEGSTPFTRLTLLIINALQRSEVKSFAESEQVLIARVRSLSTKQLASYILPTAPGLLWTTLLTGFRSRTDNSF